MSLTTLIRGRSQPRANTLVDPAVPLTAVSLLDWLGLGSSSTGKSVTPSSALGMPAVWRAVNLIAGTGASLPLHAYSSDGPARVLRTSGAAADLLAAPHPDLTPFEVWELGFTAVLAWGNAAYLKLRDGAGVVRELWWLHPERVRYGRAKDGTKVYHVQDFDRALSDREILHVPGFGYDGISGVSVLAKAREAVALSQAAEEYGARLWGSGSLITGILSTDQRLTPEQAQELKDRWKSAGVGLASAHDIRVLGSGANFTPMSIPPADAQFVESRRFQIEEVARMFGIPPHLLGETAKSTSWGTGLEEQNLGFLAYTMRTWLSRFEQRITQILTPGGVYARFSVEGLLRANSGARADFYAKLWNLGVLSTNDIRALEELPPVEGGDVRYRPLNMGVLGQDDTVTEPPGPPPPARPERAISTEQAYQLLGGERA